MEEILCKENLDIIKNLDPGQFNQWFSKYCYPWKEDIPKLEKMCQKIKSKQKKERFFTKEELRNIIEWKLAFNHGRQQKILRDFDTTETDEKIHDKTRVVFDESVSVAEKVHRIAGHGGGRQCRQCKGTKIAGVGISVASAILRFIDPLKYPIIDQKSMDALYGFGFRGLPERKKWGKRPQYRFEPNDYARYQELIKKISEKVNLSPSQVDMALWQSRKNQCET